MFREHLRGAMGGSPLIGAWVKLPTTLSIELLSHAGMDFVVIDLEHATIDESMAAQQVAIARALGISPLVRIPRGATHEVTRMLDAAVEAVIFPRIGSVADATFAADQLRFEPHGTRGMGITGRAGDWALLGMDAYFSEARRPMSVALIESVSGVQEIEAILNDAKIEAILLGPADLALSLGLGTDANHPNVQAAVARVISAARSASIPCGVALGSAANVPQLTALGCSFFVLGNDATLLGGAAIDLVRRARPGS
jgi:2-keto-3-deoxy-L-rhamnonate aldolase RhmA